MAKAEKVERRFEWAEIESLARMGWIRITDVGEENVYFVTAAGDHYFCKVG